jgi:hypothetical protein
MYTRYKGCLLGRRLRTSSLGGASVEPRWLLSGREGCGALARLVSYVALLLLLNRILSS